MNILLDNNDFNIENVFLMENKENIIMNGIFVKMLYSSQYFTMNGIYMKFPIQDYEKTNFTPLHISNVKHNQRNFIDKNVHNHKNVLLFDVEKNGKLISQFSKIENDIINFYMNSKNIKNKKIVNSINTQLKNGMIKYYNYKYLHGLHMCNFTGSISKHKNEHCDSDCISHIQSGMNKFYIKISGIWETNTEIGVAYKVIYY